MTKRFTTNGYKIYDTFHDGIHWLVNQVEANEIVDKMNNLDSKARERSKALSKLQKENEQLKQQKEVWKQICCANSNFNSILLHELDIAREQGFEVSNPFKQFLEDKGDV